MSTPTQADHEAAARKLIDAVRADADGTGPTYRLAVPHLVRRIAAALSEAVRVAVEKEKADAALFVQRLPWVDELGKPSSNPPSCDTIIEALKIRASTDAQATPAPADALDAARESMAGDEAEPDPDLMKALEGSLGRRGTPPETGEK